MDSPHSSMPTLEYVMSSPAQTINSSIGGGASMHYIGDTPKLIMSSPEMVRSSPAQTPVQTIQSSRGSVQTIKSSRGGSVRRNLFSP